MGIDRRSLVVRAGAASWGSNPTSDVMGIFFATSPNTGCSQDVKLRNYDVAEDLSTNKTPL